MKIREYVIPDFSTWHQNHDAYQAAFTRLLQALQPKRTAAPALVPWKGFALEEYKAGCVSKAELRRWLGIETRYELDGFLKEHHAYIEATVEDLGRDRKPVNDQRPLPTRPKWDRPSDKSGCHLFQSQLSSKTLKYFFPPESKALNSASSRRKTANSFRPHSPVCEKWIGSQGSCPLGLFYFQQRRLTQMSLETIAPPAVAPHIPTSEQQGTPTPDSAVHTIPVSGGPNALCDEEDFPLLSLFSWHVNKSAHLSYPTTRLGGRLFYMHHLVILQPHKANIYHHDGNLFNNGRANLCIASKAQINASASKQKRPCSSIYKGVSWSKNRAKWEAYHSVSGTRMGLGSFLSEEAAARAYDQAAYATYGDFARLNFPRTKVAHDLPLSKITEEARQNWSLTTDGAAIIPTTNGPDAVCDPEDLTFLSRLTWRVESVGDFQYPVARLHGRDIFMHHWVLRCTEKRRLVHQDGNGLNNRRRNLLAVSCSQIFSGKRNSEGATSCFKGVFRIKGNWWLAKIIVRGTCNRIGSFKREEDAARAYDAAARAAFGSFAYQNFPEHPLKEATTNSMQT